MQERPWTVRRNSPTLDPLPGDRPATRSPARSARLEPVARTARSFVPSSGPACPSLGAWSGTSCAARVTHNRPGLSIASSARADRWISRSGPAGRDGRPAGRKKRTALAMPGRCEGRHADARSSRSWWKSAWDNGPDARERLLASLCFRANPSHQPAGMIRFGRERISMPAHKVLQVPRNPSAQFPEGVGRSRPLWVVSLTSGAGGASSPAIAGVISAGTEAMVAVGLAAR